MPDTKPMKGKDADCGLYDCPHKQALSNALDEVTMLEKKNQELNERLESIDNMISQGLVDFKGLLREILKDREITPDKIEQISKEINRTFDTAKITDIVNENLGLRKTINSKDMKITELTADLNIIKQQKEALEVANKAREEKDISLIKSIREAGFKSQEQLRDIELKDKQIRQKEIQLKALESFIAEARNTIKGFKLEHEELLKANKQLKEENIFIGFVAKKTLSPKGKRALRLIKACKSLKNSHKGLLLRLKYRSPETAYNKLKALYFGLNEVERTSLSNDYDEVAKLYGE